MCPKKCGYENARGSIDREVPIGPRGPLPDVIPVTSSLAVNRLELPMGSGPHARVFTMVIKRVNRQNLLVHAFGATTFNLPHSKHDERLPRGVHRDAGLAAQVPISASRSVTDLVRMLWWVAVTHGDSCDAF